MKSNKNMNDSGDDGGIKVGGSEIYASKTMSGDDKKTPTPPDLPKKVRVDYGPVGTSTKQMAGYFTISGIQNETTVLEKDWPLFALKENCDNSWDWLNDFYATTVPMNVYNYRARRYIGIRAWIDKISGDPNETRIFHLCVRNSNTDEIRIQEFEQLDQIFNYAQWQSTKRYQHRATTGALGDYLKRHGGMSHASWTDNIKYDTANYDDDNRQWPIPIFLRFNGKEYQVYVSYNKYTGIPSAVIEGPTRSDATKYTEVECSLPISKVNCDGDPNASNALYRMSLVGKLLRYYKLYKFGKANTFFSLDLRYTENNIHITEADN